MRLINFVVIEACCVFHAIGCICFCIRGMQVEISVVDVMLTNESHWLNFWTELATKSQQSAVEDEPLKVVLFQWKDKCLSVSADGGGDSLDPEDSQDTGLASAADGDKESKTDKPIATPPAKFCSIVAARDAVRPPDSKVDSPIIASFMAQLQAFVTTGATMGIIEKLQAVIRPEINLNSIGHIEACCDTLRSSCVIL